MRLFGLIGGLLDRFSVVIGAFLGSQIPEYFQQYTQRLAGHVTELNRLLENLKKSASYSNKTLDQYIQKFLSNADPDFIRQGEFMNDINLRWQKLHLALDHLTHSSIIERPFVFIKDMQYDIAQATLASFQPGINLSVEGLCYASVGIILGLTLYQLIYKCLKVGCLRAVAIFKESV